MEPSEVKGDDLLICSPTVPGFSLRRKMWGECFIFPLHGNPKPRVANEFGAAEFAVDDIKDIKWQPEALSHLQIREKTKRAIQALLQAHITSTNSFSFDDLIAGKGQGFNVLM